MPGYKPNKNCVDCGKLHANKTHDRCRKCHAKNPGVCCIDGCEKPITNRTHELCNAHNLRRTRHGHPLAGMHKQSREGNCTHPGGCDKPIWANGLCGMHDQRSRQRNGDIGGASAEVVLAAEIIEWIADLCAKPPAECVPWPWSVCPSTGYGQTRYEGKQMTAHRAILATYEGSMPDGLECCHGAECATSGAGRRCVNPLHLSFDTGKVNASHRKRDDTNNHGERNGQSKLTEEQARAIKNDPRTQRAIAGEYGLSHVTVGDIKRGRRWKHL